MFFAKKPTTSVSWLVVFLGNTGSKYDNTRHNVGFMSADYAEAETSAKITRLKYKSLTATCKIGESQVMLMKPQTYMNLSGEAVVEAARFYKIPAENIIVISDDVSMAVGKIRIRKKGSAGGHNGLKNIIAKLGTDEFPRIKIGVGAPPHPDYDMADWVLGKFVGQDAKDVEAAVKLAFDAAVCYITEGADKAMNKFSQK